MLLLILVAGTTSFLANSALYLLWRKYPTLSVKQERQDQDFHVQDAPRTGGIGLIAALLVSFFLVHDLPLKWMLLICILPSFIAGLLDDLLKIEVSPWIRLGMTTISGAFALIFLDAHFDATGISFIDVYMQGNVFFSIFCILVIVTAAAHCTNVIDGFNGLLLGYTILACTAFAVVSLLVDDYPLASVFLIILGASIGIFVINFPGGRVFCGDSGAYVIGSILALCAILLLDRNNSLSPWLPMTFMAYPVGETLFSIIRKRLILGKPAMQPDRFHLHMIIHELLRRHFNLRATRFNTNAATSPFLWLLATLPIAIALFYPTDTKVLIIICLAFASVYICLYLILILKLVSLKTIDEN